MAQVTITINSREYAIACENGQEGRIMQLALMLEEKAKLLKNISGQINENLLLAMVGILIADDLMEARKYLAATETDAKSKLNRDADRVISVKLKNVLSEIKSVAKELETL